MKTVLKIILAVLSIVLLIVGIVTIFMGDGFIAVPIIEIIAAVLLLLITAFIGRKPQGFGKIWRVLAVCLAAVFAVVGTASVLLGLNTKGAPAADRERMVEIWGDTIPGNSSRSKLDDMNYNDNAHLLGATLRFTLSIVGDEYSDVEKNIDTFTYLHGIKGGYEKETYEDVPYLIPYLVENSDRAVIVVPGGGYGYKSIDGANGEGRDVAVALNEQGISAFVLWYRSNPYEMPIPQLDLQRAVRYVRFHADDYGISPEKISLIGYSAGGYQIGSFINRFMGENTFPDGYQKDEIDLVDDCVNCAAMIYPALTFRYNVNMLFCAFDAESVRNKQEREDLLNSTDLSKQFNSTGVRQLVCYGTKDKMVGGAGAKEYIAAARAADAQITEVVAADQDHGFAQKYYMDEFLDLIENNL